MDENDMTKMTAALTSEHPAGAGMRNAFPVPEKQQAAIRKTIKDVFATNAAIEFQTALDLVGAIELIAGGQNSA
jgi:hypothetical protein